MKKQRKKPGGPRDGALLITVLVVMTAVAAIGAAIAGITASAAHNRIWTTTSSRAYYLSESGGEYAKYLVSLDETARPSGTFLFANNSGSFILNSYTDPTDAERVVVESTGVYKDARHRITFNFIGNEDGGGGTWDGSGDLTEENTLNPDPGDMTFSVEEFDGDLALRIDSLRSADDFRGWIFIRESLLFVTASDFLRAAWEHQGEYLSFEVQVKAAVNFLGPQVSYMEGLCFRLMPDERCYGLSFARAHDTSIDGVPTEFIPDEPFCIWPGWGGSCWLWGSRDISNPLIVLWQDVGDASADKRWLVTKDMVPSDNLLNGDELTHKYWDTLMIRIDESPSISCTDISSAAIGDVVTRGGAVATIVGLPLYSSGNSGVLRLSVPDTPFTPGNALLNGTIPIEITGFRMKDNFITSFVADPDGSSPDTNPYNMSRAPHPRGEYDHWAADPVTAWTEESDRFTIVTWDRSNTASPVTHEVLGPSGHPSTVIRTADLVSPSGTFDGPEVGVHTFGWNNVDFTIFDQYRKDYYFDDFALRVDEWGAEGVPYQY